jgi:hypothetical protein
MEMRPWLMRQSNAGRGGAHVPSLLGFQARGMGMRKRKPAVAGLFYPDDPKSVSEVEDCDIHLR